MYRLRLKRRVLMIDNKDVIKAVKDTLEGKDYEVMGYETEQGAIEQVKKSLEKSRSNDDISVLLVHIDLNARTDGIEIAERILRLYQNGYSKLSPEVVFKAGYYNDYQRERAERITSIPIVEAPLNKKGTIRLVDKAHQNYCRRKQLS